MLVVFWRVGSCLWLRGEQYEAVMSPDGAVRCENEMRRRDRAWETAARDRSERIMVMSCLSIHALLQFRDYSTCIINLK